MLLEYYSCFTFLLFTISYICFRALLHCSFHLLLKRRTKIATTYYDLNNWLKENNNVLRPAIYMVYIAHRSESKFTDRFANTLISNVVFYFFFFCVGNLI